MEKYLDGEEISALELRQALRGATLRAQLVPVLCGTALRNKGVQPVLEAVVDYLPSPLDVPPMVGIDPLGLDFAQEYLKGKEPFFRCILGYVRIYIDSYKNVYSGCWALPPIGNLDQEELKTLLKSRKYRERLKKMYQLECPYCTCGYLINCLVNHPFSGLQFIFRNISLVKS